jgi:predicted enzyme related to lactoylglutathione lyase
MSISVLAISFDARDAAQLAHFWAQALHRTVNDSATEEFASIAAGTDSRLGAMLMFHKVPEGKTVKNRLHIDLQAADIVAEAGRLTNLGAQQIRSLAENNNRWISLRDPEGNEFDLVGSG